MPTNATQPDKQIQTALDFLAAGNFNAAKTLLGKICANSPKDAQAWNLLGATNAELGQLDTAVSCCVKAIGLAPFNPHAQYNLGKIYSLSERYDEALNCFQEASRLKPDYEAALYNQGVIYELRRQWGASLENYRHAIQVNPRNSDALNRAGSILSTMGEHREATLLLRKALSLKPDFIQPHSNILFSMNEIPTPPETLLSEHKNWFDQHGKNLYKKAVHHRISETQDENRKLRVGYVSPDFKNHPVKYFFEPILENHNREKFVITCYSNTHPSKHDQVTEKIRNLADIWQDIQALSDDATYDLIVKDRIDILIDLTGHSAGNRLLLFCMKPAPVQITYLGYPSTTGLGTMDYRLTDEWADPIGKTERWHTETLARLPHGFLCYKPTRDLPKVSTLPMIQNAHVTFGSFNAARKITSAVIRLWATVMHRCPNSRLVLKNSQLEISSVRNKLYSAFSSHGIQHDRIDLLTSVADNYDHMNLYSKIDIALDTFPYNGTTTTCDALIMGVPVITIAGNTHASRVGISLLSQVGLNELIAMNEDEFIKKAASLATDSESLSKLRANLRHQTLMSDLCNGPKFTASLETLYLSKWKEWVCQSHITTAL